MQITEFDLLLKLYNHVIYQTCADWMVKSLWRSRVKSQSYYCTSLFAKNVKI